MTLDIEKITARAYQLSQERIGKGSAPMDDWLKAEWEVKNAVTQVSEMESVSI